MKILTLTKTNFFIGCVLTCFTLTACDDAEEKQKQVITPPLVTVQTETNNAEVNIDELDNLLNEISVETGKPLNEPQPPAKPKVEPIKQVVENKPIVPINTNILAKSLSKGLATGFNYQLVNNKQWQQAEKECFGRVGDDFVVTELETLVKTELNQDELQQATKFYNSVAGKQLEKWRDSHLTQVVENKNLSVENMNIAKENVAEINEFMESSANIKINQLLQSPQIEQLIAEKIAPQLLACGMAENNL